MWLVWASFLSWLFTFRNEDYGIPTILESIDSCDYPAGGGTLDGAAGHRRDSEDGGGCGLRRGSEDEPNKVTPIKSWLKKHLEDTEGPPSSPNHLAVAPSRPVYIIPQVTGLNIRHKSSLFSAAVVRVFVISQRYKTSVLTLPHKWDFLKSVSQVTTFLTRQKFCTGKEWEKVINLEKFWTGPSILNLRWREMEKRKMDAFNSHAGNGEKKRLWRSCW